MLVEPTVQTLSFTPELDRAYRLYAAKTIEDRALPDVRDGCKPVQRRILYAMHDMGLRATAPPRKSARIVGEVLGKYHPHGDQSVYGALVRLAQPFALREPLIDGQGNFGSVDGDNAAAMRYTEARLSALGELLLADIEADTVAWADTFDTAQREPAVLPAAFPNLLVNGAAGIAVGMATCIPPHNLGEIADALRHVVRNWRRRDALTTAELMRFVPGPDFPTGGVLYRYREVAGEVQDTLLAAYERGHGSIVAQARLQVEDIGGGKAHIVIAELPYGVQKTTLLERIAKEVKDGHIRGVTDLRDESDFDTGMRVVVEVSRTARPAEVIEDLLRHSQLQETIGCNHLALVPDPETGAVRPRRLALRELLVHYVTFRLEVIVCRSRHELARRKERQHIVAGLLAALAAIDEVVRIIRRSRTPESAQANLQATLGLSAVQAKAILDMPLRRLTALEAGKLREEQRSLRTRIAVLQALLKSEPRRLEEVAAEVEALKARFATPRRTVILDRADGVAGLRVVTESDLRVPDGPQMVVVTTAGLERRPAGGYRYAPAEGLTRRATTSHLQVVRAKPTDQVLLVATDGRAWRHAVGFVPERAAATELGLPPGERVIAAAVRPPAAAGACLVLGSRGGRIKRTRLDDLEIPPGRWSQVLGLGDDDALLFAAVATDAAEVVWATAGGQLLRASAGEVNPQASGTARGVAGITLKPGDRLIAAVVVDAGRLATSWVYVASAAGYVKRSALADFPRQRRGSQGVQMLAVSAQTGPVAAVAIGRPGGALDLIYGDGKRQRIPGDDVPAENRYRAGWRLAAVEQAGAAIVAATCL